MTFSFNILWIHKWKTKKEVKLYKPVSEPHAGWQKDSESPGPNEEALPLFLSAGQKRLRFPPGDAGGWPAAEAQAISVLHEMLQQSFSLSTQSAPLVPGIPPSWSSSALDSISSWNTWAPAWGRWWERKTLPWEERAPHRPWRGTSRDSTSTWMRRDTVTVSGKLSEWR